MSRHMWRLRLLAATVAATVSATIAATTFAAIITVTTLGLAQLDFTNAFTNAAVGSPFSSAYNTSCSISSANSTSSADRPIIGPAHGRVAPSFAGGHSPITANLRSGNALAMPVTTCSSCTRGMAESAKH